MTDADGKIMRAVKADYLGSRDSPGTIAARHGISVQKLTYWRRRDSWPERRQTEEKPIGPPPVQPKPDHPKPSDDRGAVIARVWQAIDAALTRLEGAMKKGRRPTSMDAEREARALGALIRNLGIVAELENDAGRSGREESDAATIDPDSLRNTLAERLGHLQRSAKRGDPEGADGS